MSTTEDGREYYYNIKTKESVSILATFQTCGLPIAVSGCNRIHDTRTNVATMLTLCTSTWDTAIHIAGGCCGVSQGKG
jgi:hypothetical protein